MFVCQAEDGIRELVRSRGLGDVYKRQAAHRTNRLPLLPSGPGGVHRVLLHRARPRYSYDIYPIPSIREAMVEQTLMADEGWHSKSRSRAPTEGARPCLLYTSDAADERSSVDLGGRRIIKKQRIA